LGQLWCIYQTMPDLWRVKKLLSGMSRITEIGSEINAIMNVLFYMFTNFPLWNGGIDRWMISDKSCHPRLIIINLQPDRWGGWGWYGLLWGWLSPLNWDAQSRVVAWLIFVRSGWMKLWERYPLGSVGVVRPALGMASPTLNWDAQARLVHDRMAESLKLRIPWKRASCICIQWICNPGQQTEIYCVASPESPK
jgi:hypothetical protein